MAAAKVFAVPELLENILLRLADMVLIDELKRCVIAEVKRLEGFCDSLEPLKSLAPCHRVSREFNSALVGSCKLQRLMFGDCNPSYDGLSLPKSAPIMWLLAVQHKFTECVRSAGGRSFDFMYAIHFRSKAIRAIAAPKGQRASEASWRRVKCHRGVSKESKPLVGPFRSVDEDSTHSERHPYMTDDFLDVIEMHGDCTLGTFEAWLNTSACSGHTKEYAITEFRMGGDSLICRDGNRGTLKDPQVLRESPAKDGNRPDAAGLEAKGCREACRGGAIGREAFGGEAIG